MIKIDKVNMCGFGGRFVRVDPKVEERALWGFEIEE